MKGKHAVKLEACEYVRVVDSDPGTNLVTANRTNGMVGDCDPRLLDGV